MRLGTPTGRCGPRLCRRGVVLVSLLGYLAALVGYPLPARVRQTSSQPFPCQHHACGCVDAEQCWRSCCCFTPSQKLAWARAHHVTPPAYAECESSATELATQAHHDDHDHAACHAHSAGCQHQCAEHHAGDPDDCGQLAGGAAGRCCASHLAQEHDATQDTGPHAMGGKPCADSPRTNSSSKVHFVSSDAWRRCRGLPTLWVTTGAAIPPPIAQRWQFSWVVVEWLSTVAPDLCGGGVAPPVPPPRV